jgi:hypothetical protein
VHENVVARREFLALEHEQADVAFDAAGNAATHESVNRLNLHGYGEAHYAASGA